MYYYSAITFLIDCLICTPARSRIQILDTKAGIANKQLVVLERL